jgi:hypothetical protein
MTPQTPEERDPDLAALEDLEQDLAALERDLEIVDDDTTAAE